MFKMQPKWCLKMLITQHSCSNVQLTFSTQTPIGTSTIQQRKHKFELITTTKEKQKRLVCSVMATTGMIIVEGDDIESYSEESLCLDKAKELLALINLPTGLLPLKEMTEVGYNRTKGFVWMRMRSKIEHTFRAIGRKVLYDTEITAFVEDRRMKRLTGVKSKELMIWVPVNDIFIKEKDPEKITFANTTGLSRTFKVSAFQGED